MKHPSLEALFSDDSLLIINKIAGIACVADRFDSTLPHLLPLLEPRWGKLWLVHRLDKDTSGVLALARSLDAHRYLNAQFQDHNAEKSYHALVAGNPAWDEETIDLPLRIDADRQHHTRVDRQDGKPSITHLRVLEQFEPFSLIEARPQTGRTHQIRVHLAELGFPVVVDPLYGTGEPIWLSRLKRKYRAGSREEQPLLNRLGLHAYNLILQHPADETRREWTAPYSKDFKATINQLRKLH